MEKIAVSCGMRIGSQTGRKWEKHQGRRNTRLGSIYVKAGHAGFQGENVIPSRTVGINSLGFVHSSVHDSPIYRDQTRRS